MYFVLKPTYKTAKEHPYFQRDAISGPRRYSASGRPLCCRRYRLCTLNPKPLDIPTRPMTCPGNALAIRRGFSDEKAITGQRCNELRTENHGVCRTEARAALCIIGPTLLS
ncbi:uncharacterized protein [Periplaneta americana]|uniref:uncharacterized protein isoform X2 n=1 Tax=Periplaneta americana TaxID=6978 RepID=UPI0037E93405